MKKLIILLLFPILTFAQWTKQQSKAGEPSYGLNIPAFTKQLNAKKATVPDASGNLSQYALIEDFNFADDKIAKKYGLRSFHGFDKDGRSISIAVSKEGVEATITDSLQTFVQPTGNGYKIGRVESKREFSCDVDERQIISDFTERAKVNQKAAAVRGDITILRVAMSFTAEFVQRLGGTQEKVFTWQNRVLTNVNSTFRKELAAVVQLVPGNEKLIFYSKTKDYPFTHTGNYAAENQKLVDAKIGTANYDMACVYGLGIGGNATKVGSVTDPLFKGQCFVLYLDPANAKDDFNVNTHEWGHQVNGIHTRSYVVGTGNVEPGSGVTIMSHAGAAPAAYNVAANSSPIFHPSSAVRIIQYLSTLPLGSITTGNRKPTVNAGADRVIEADTPFSLSAVTSDPDGDKVTIRIAQIDLTPPLFTKPNRLNYSGALQLVSADTQTGYVNFTNNGTWNVLPGIPRTMNFRVFAMDGKGGVAWDDIKVTVIPKQIPVSNAPILSYVPGSLTKTSVKLQWSVPVNFPVTEYSIYRNPTCDNSEKAGAACENYLTKTTNTFITVTFNAADKLKGSVIYVVKGKNSDGWRTEKSNSLMVEIPK